MIRKYIYLKDLEIYDQLHKRTDNGFEVDEAKDGQSTERHIEGINYIKGVLNNGQKIRPILVLDNEDGTYKRLDGFKRCIAHIELGIGIIEAFIVSQEEYRRADDIPYHGGMMKAWHGGQFKESYGLFEGGERPDFNYDETIFLYNSPNPDGLKIELSEHVHVHWEKFGRYRLDLGRKDFEVLAKAISKIDG